jgi:hypothetical protein
MIQKASCRSAAARYADQAAIAKRNESGRRALNSTDEANLIYRSGTTPVSKILGTGKRSMDTSDRKRAMMSTKPLHTAILYDFYMFLQLVALILLCIGLGRLAFLVDEWKTQGRLTSSLIHFLEWIANFAVLRK